MRHTAEGKKRLWKGATESKQIACQCYRLLSPRPSLLPGHLTLTDVRATADANATRNHHHQSRNPEIQNSTDMGHMRIYGFAIAAFLFSSFPDGRSICGCLFLFFLVLLLVERAAAREAAAAG